MHGSALHGSYRAAIPPPEAGVKKKINIQSQGKNNFCNVVSRYNSYTEEPKSSPVITRGENFSSSAEAKESFSAVSLFMFFLILNIRAQFSIKTFHLFLLTT